MNFQEYKTLEYPSRTVISLPSDDGPRLQAAFSTSYRFATAKKRNYAASVFEKDANIIKVSKWVIRRTKEKGNARSDFYVSIYWWRN